MARDPALDTARATAMVLVVATHAALSFMVTPIGWAVQDRSQNLGFDLFAWIVRAFAMPTFFWLSGYFSRVVLERGGLRGFVRHRVVRILIPLALAVVPCSLVLSAMWDWGREVSLRAEVASNIPKLQSSEIPIVLGHLWFLYYLLWLSLVAMAIRIARVRVPEGMVLVAIPAAITFGVLASLHAVHTDTPLGFVPDVPIAIYMGAYFAWGWWTRPDQLRVYDTLEWRSHAIAPLFLAVEIPTLAGGTTAPWYASAASALFTIAMMIALLGLCVRYARANRVVRLASAASYWTYIVHVPIVVALQIVLARVAVPGPLKYVAIVAIAMASSVASYAVFERLKARRIKPAHR